jgi:hypothetical protein
MLGAIYTGLALIYFLRLTGVVSSSSLDNATRGIRIRRPILSTGISPYGWPDTYLAGQCQAPGKLPQPLELLSIQALSCPPVFTKSPWCTTVYPRILSQLNIVFGGVFMQNSTQANVTNSDRRTRKGLKEAAIRLYRLGYSQAEILRNKERLAEIDRLGAVWQSLTQSHLSRWINAAKEDDFDLEIWHLLGRRRFRPDIYTNWKPEGKIIVPFYHDPLTDTLYLTPDGDYYPYPPGVKEPSKIVRGGKKKAPRTRQEPKRPGSDAAGPYVAMLRAMNYSIREIQHLWNGEGTKYPKLDESPLVQLLVHRLKEVRPTAMSHQTIWRIPRRVTDSRLTERAKRLQNNDESWDDPWADGWDPLLFHWDRLMCHRPRSDPPSLTE